MKKLTSAIVLAVMPMMGFADQVINDDLIVDGSQCVGIDCASGLNFGFDTLILKENNVRLLFDDTSSSGSFNHHGIIARAIHNFEWRNIVRDVVDSKITQQVGVLRPGTYPATRRTSLSVMSATAVNCLSVFSRTPLMTAWF